MAGSSFRDRFYTRKVSRAVTAPSSILTFGGAASIGIVAASSLALPLTLAVAGVAGAAAYGLKVLLAMPRKGNAEGIDPFAVGEPWRRFVTEALQARARFDQSLGSMKAGPLRDNLSHIGDRLQDAVDECWRVARRGQAIADARSQIKIDSARYELAQMQQQAQERWAAGSTVARTAEALQAQIASAERMDQLVVEIVDQLRLLDARMDETVTRAIELGVQADSPDDLSGLGADVDGLVLDMEALRQALDETSGSRATPSPTGAGSGTDRPSILNLPGTPPPPDEGTTEPPTASGTS